MDRVQTIEIRVVHNGYWVGPGFEGNRTGYMTGDSVNVFQTFESLVKWLRENLKETCKDMVHEE